MSSFCIPFPETHPYHGTYVMVKTTDGDMAQRAMNIAHGASWYWQVFTEAAFFETRERWNMHRLACISWAGEDVGFKIDKTWSQFSHG